MQQATSERRKNRVPLSPEELFYFIQLKKLKQTQQLLQFKKSTYYKRLNTLNITFVFFISYIVLSALFLCRWEKAYVLNLDSRYGAYDPGKAKRSFSDVMINTTQGHSLNLKTSDLYELPKKFDVIWVGRDFLFGKIVKARLVSDGGSYFHITTYPLLFICLFVMFIVYLIYYFNLHLTRHGLTGITALLSLTFIYILCV